MSSILSTSSCGEGTHTTSLPDCPTSGVYSTLGAWAKAQTAIADKIRIEKHRLAERHTDMFLLQVVGRKGTRARGTEWFPLARPLPARRSAPVCGPGLLHAGEMMGPQHSGRQPLQLPGRNWDGTFVPVQSEGEPHRQLLMIEPGAGRPPVLSSGAKVRSWKSILRSPNPRNDALMTPTSSVVTVSTYMDTSLASQPQFPGPGGSPPELYSSVTAFLQGLNAIIASDILARIEFALTPGKTRAASTPMIMITIMSSTMVNPACRLLVLRIWLTVSRWIPRSKATQNH